MSAFTISALTKKHVHVSSRENQFKTFCVNEQGGNKGAAGNTQFAQCRNLEEICLLNCKGLTCNNFALVFDSKYKNFKRIELLGNNAFPDEQME